jgi:hypothetical protein
MTIAMTAAKAMNEINEAMNNLSMAFLFRLYPFIMAGKIIQGQFKYYIMPPKSSSAWPFITCVQITF